MSSCATIHRSLVRLQRREAGGRIERTNVTLAGSPKNSPPPRHDKCRRQSRSSRVLVVHAGEPSNPWLTPQLSMAAALDGFQGLGAGWRPAARTKASNTMIWRIKGRFVKPDIGSRDRWQYVFKPMVCLKASTTGRVTNAFPGGSLVRFGRSRKRVASERRRWIHVR